VKDVVYGMIHQDWRAITEEGRRRAIRLGKDVLVSMVFEVPRADLPSLFSYSDARSAGYRFFWSEPSRRLSFAGYGCALLIESDDPAERFRQVETRWREAAADCVVADRLPAHTGPHLFGGFSFDPARTRSEQWRHFGAASFFVPRVMWTECEGRTWVTINRRVGAEGEYDGHEAPLDEADDVLGARASCDGEVAERDHSAGYIYKEEIAPSDWLEAVAQAAAAIRAGHMRKIVLARHIRLKAERPFSIECAIRNLLRDQHNTYVFAMERGADVFVGATPERLVRSEGNVLRTLSLAGSIARGRTDEEDRRLGEKLYRDEKNLHEHALAVEMIKDVMAELCVSVQAPDHPQLYKLKDIQHLLTPISGQARTGVTLLRAAEKLHPTPALGGMPQQAALEAIRRLENMDRGWYAAPIGWLNRTMDGEFAAAIRSALVQGQEASLYAGCGIVGDSDPRSEYEETALKFRPMLSALGADRV